MPAPGSPAERRVAGVAQHASTRVARCRGPGGWGTPGKLAAGPEVAKLPRRLFDRLGLKLECRDAPPQRQGRRRGRSLRAAVLERSPHGAQRGDHLGLPAPDAGRGLPQQTLVERTPRQADPAAEEQQVDIGTAAILQRQAGFLHARGPVDAQRPAPERVRLAAAWCRRRAARFRWLRQRALSGGCVHGAHPVCRKCRLRPSSTRQVRIPLR